MKITTSLIILFNMLFYVSASAQYLDPDDYTSLGTFNPSTSVYIDMSTRSMTGGVTATGVMEGSILVFTFDEFTLGQDIYINFQNVEDNDDKIAFLSKGDMNIYGIISANASSESPGPGGRSGESFWATTNPIPGKGPGGGGAGENGAGGGGFGAAGGDAGDGTSGGIAYASSSTSLLGGSSGGFPAWTYIDNSTNNTCGGSGGSLELGAGKTLTFYDGSLVRAAGGHAALITQESNGGGGGSGGDILVHAKDITISSNAEISAKGGSGGMTALSNANGGGGGGGGRIRIAYKSSGTNNGTVTAAGGPGGSAISGGNDGSPGGDFTPVFMQDDNVPVSLFSGGSGTSGDPYQIATTEDLIVLSNTSAEWDKYFIQTADISFNSDETQVDWDGSGSAGPSEGFSPIGNSTTKFTGSYDGQSYTITNLFINRAITDDIGLFGFLSGAAITGINLAAVDFTGDTGVGGLAGQDEGSTVISACTINGTSTIDGVSYVGGFIGHTNTTGSISDCQFSGTVSANTLNGKNCVGGFAGYMGGFGTISECGTSGTVNGNGNRHGGFVGWIDNGEIRRCYSAMTVFNTSTTDGQIGGFVGAITYIGAATSGKIYNCYATGSVTADNTDNTSDFGIGGFVGSYTSEGQNKIENSYSTGAVSATNATNYVGGFSGEGYGGDNDDGAIDCFWDTETSGQASSADSETGKTTAEMKTQSTFTNWNFTTGTGVWEIQSGAYISYPYLQAITYDAPGTTPEVNPIPGLEEVPPYSGGSGTSGDPFQIATIDDLIELSNTSDDWGAYFIQTADISFNSDETQVDWDGSGSAGPAEGFSPIGNSTTQFSGDYDGQNYTINNLYIDRPSTNLIGLFGIIDGASISNLGTTDVEIIGDSFVGGLIGSCYLYTSSVENCFTTGTVTGNEHIGGFIGDHSNNTINKCYSLVNVFGMLDTGGFMGYNTGGATISNSYSMGDVTRRSGSTNTRFGGFAGYNSETIENCYSTGKVYESAGVPWSSGDKGFNGFSTGTYNNNFFDSEASGQTSGTGATAKTTAEMKDYNTFTDETTTGLTTAWDFVTNPNDDAANNDYWDMDQYETVNSGYPILSWQDGADNKLYFFSGGDGTSGDPYQIATTDDLIELSNLPDEWDKFFIQTADISFDSDETQVDWDGDGTLEHDTGGDDTFGFYPIGIGSTQFTGDYDGQDYTINNLFIHRPDHLGVGLFGFISDASINNLGVTNVQITAGNTKVGGLVGGTTSSSLENCFTTGTVTGYAFTGGFAGALFTSTTVNTCYSLVNVTGTTDVGGFVGRIANLTTISNSYCAGDVTRSSGDNTRFGGFTGYNESTISKCYSTSKVYESVGVIWSSGDKGFVGYNFAGGIYSNNFFDSEASGQTSGTGATAKTTAEMKDYNTFTDETTTGLTAAWDFVTNPNDDAANNDYWDMDQYETVNSGYPILSWQDGADNKLYLFSGGDGTSGDPYQIATTDDLIELSNTSAEWDKYFIQTADISFNSDETAVDWDGDGTLEHSTGGDDSYGFSPIGNGSPNFTGDYDGQKYTVNNLYIDRPSKSNVGLFGIIHESSISNLGVTNVQITGNSDVGGLFGNGNLSLTTSSIENCFTTGTVIGFATAGGFGGRILNSTVNNCYSLVNVTSVHGAGSFAGDIDYPTTTVSNSYSMGDVTRSSGTNAGFGGFAGTNSATIENCYATGVVYESTGSQWSSGDKGFVGINYSGTYNNNFFDKDASGQTSGTGATAKTTAEMKTQSTFTSWNFTAGTGVWEIQSGNYISYPYLQSVTYDEPGTTPAVNPIPGLEFVPYSGGSGTSGDPYQIATTEDLIELSNTATDWDKYFIQTANISFDSDETQVDWDGDGTIEHGTGGDDSYGFSPIGNSTTKFTGSYDGQSYTITNLFIDRYSTNDIGLFGFLSSAEITNTNLAAVDITGNTGVGGLAGQDEGATTISGCTISGSTTILGVTNVGGFIGDSNTSGSISDCNFSGTVSADNADAANSVGGFVGAKGGTGTIAESGTSGTVNGAGRNQGGFVGWMYNGEIRRCYSTMAVVNTSTTQGRIGGFVGGHAYYLSTSGQIYNCYATGSVTADATNNTTNFGIGGFVGSFYAASNNKIYNSYSTGAVSATNASSYVGGFSGEDFGGGDGAIDCFWNTETSGQSTSADSETGKTTAEMKDYNTFTDENTIGLTTAWDFVTNPNDDAANNDYWDMDQELTVNNGYPILSWQDGADEELYLFSGGGGTAGDPYQIATTNDLVELSNVPTVWDKYFIQTADISFNSDETLVDWDGSGSNGPTEGFSPIGNSTTNFTGNYNGQNYAINNLFINRPSTDYIGLFGAIDGALLSNLGVTNVEITGYNNVGGLIGSTNNSSLENSYTTGTVTGYKYIGGFVGVIYTTAITQCYSLANVTGGDGAGGFSGFSETPSTISNSYSRGDVTSTGSTEFFGGFTGISKCIIENCYATGIVYESEGVIWTNEDKGFVGINYSGTYNNNFFDSEASQQTSGTGATAKTTAEMKDFNTFTDETTTGLTTAWDFVTNPNDDAANNDYWDMDQELTVNNGYPILSWQEGADEVLYLFSGGIGTSGNPYQIATTDDLVELSNLSSVWDKYFIQTANISFNSDEAQVDWDGDGTASWDTEDQKGFSPIGNSTTKFTGSYDGQSFITTNLFISRTSTDDIGLFGFLSGAAITDINLAAVDYTGNIGVGGLAGQDEGNTVISGCTIDGSNTIDGVSHVGGFIGFSNTSGSISDCHFSGTVTADNINGAIQVGGFAGEKGGTGTISECSTSGTVNGNGRNHGGFVGWMNNGEINRCFAAMAVANTSTTQGRIAGFVGGIAYYESTSGQIYNCYATGSVTANSTDNSSNFGIGGFVGSYFDAGNNKIYNSYSTGAVSATSASSNVGGFSGEDFGGGDGAIDCFWDTETSGQATSADSETGKTTAEMKDVVTFTDENTTGLTTAWDFVTNPNNDAANNDYWDMDQEGTVNSGYPILSWQDGADNIIPFSGGNGTAGNPYKIATTNNLIALTNLSSTWDKYFIQTADISFNSDEAQVDWDGSGSAGPAEGFSPIGNSTTKFTGSYDGQSYTITNLFISRATTDDIGLFGFLSGAAITDINLAAVDFTGDTGVGGLAGQDEGSTVISGCTINGTSTIDGVTNVGGFIGFSNTSGSISDCHFSGTVTADNADGANLVGGFAGRKSGTGTISESGTSGTVNGNGRAHGGFVGWMNNGEISRCYATMTVANTSTTQGQIGGFAGAIAYFESTSGQIYNCYATGSVTANSTSNASNFGIGGFVGSYDEADNNKIYNSYSTGAVSATSASSGVGGFSGEEFNDGDGAIDCFWDTETSGQATSADSETGKTTDEMKDYNTFTDESTTGLTTAWDFVTNPNDDAANNDYWDMDQELTVNNGYPVLSWQDGADEVLYLFSGGIGTAGNPYQIATTVDLVELSNVPAVWDKYFIQTANISFNSDETLVDWDGDGTLEHGTGGDDSYGFSPIGNNTTKFTGSFDGQSFTTTNLFISRASTDDIGLFGFLSGAAITDINLAAVEYTGNTGVGGLAGQDEGNTVISGCTIDGSNTIDGVSHVGGFIGFSNTSGSISDCHFSGTVTADNINGAIQVGGFAGEKGGTGTISECSTSGTVNGNGRNHGGFVGWMNNGEISRCYATMAIVSTSTTQGRIGGFVGGLAFYESTSGQIYNCYATGSVTANSTTNNSGTTYGIGGFVGSYYDAGNNKIYNSYSTGAVSATSASSNVGGFSGEDFGGGDGAINCFWDTETSGQATSADSETGKTTAEMKDVVTFTDENTTGLTTAWDFVTNPNNDAANNDYWDMDQEGTVNSGYPILSWQDGADNIIPFSGGNGTAGNPYKIATTNDLIALTNLSSTWDKYFIQTADISFNSDETQVDWDGSGSAGPAEGFSPIGNSTTKFTGSYEGQSYTITNLFISRASTDDIGLFGFLSGAAISDINLAAVDFTGDTGVGGLAGQDEGSTVISGCTINGTSTIDGVTNVGGFIGLSNTSESISDCHFSGTVTADNADGANLVGGFAGRKSGTGTISACGTSGTVNGNGRAHGGFVGWMNNGEISRCYATMAVANTSTTQGQIGGFVGAIAYFESTSGQIYNCYAIGSVTANSTSNASNFGIGGFVGSYDEADNNKIYNSYSTGAVSATSASSGVGGFSGEEFNDGDGAIDCFWDTETSGQATSADSETGKTTDEMKDFNTFTDVTTTGLTTAWDFVTNPNDDAAGNDYWDMDQLGTVNNGYPILSWQDGADDILSIFSGGDGTAGDPYQIATTDDLIVLSNLSAVWEKHFIQTADLSFDSNETAVDWDGDGTASWDTEDQKGLSPLGNSTTKFTGDYDGQNYNVDYLFINRPATNNVGLFGAVNGATISSMEVTNVQITGDNNVGGLFGYLTNSSVENSFVTGIVAGIDNAGGFAGSSENASTISNSYCMVDVTRSSGTSTSFGGFAGYNAATITNCYSTGIVYESAGVTWSSGAQGFVGLNSNGNYNNNFFDKEASGQTTGTGATAKTTVEMKTESTFTGAGWDFVGETINGTDDIWEIYAYYNDGYPVFRLTQKPPAIETNAASSVAATEAVLNGNILNLGTESVTQHGFVWSTSPGPTLNDNYSEQGTVSNTGAYTYNLTNLLPCTYYVKAYATNAVGTAYGDEINFSPTSSSNSVNIKYNIRTDDFYAETREDGVGQGNADPVWHFRAQLGGSYNVNSWPQSWECVDDSPGSQAYGDGAWYFQDLYLRWSGTLLNDADNIYIGIEGWEDESGDVCTYNTGIFGDDKFSEDIYDYHSDLDGTVTRDTWSDFINEEQGDVDYVDCGTFGNDDYFKIEFDVKWNYSIPADVPFSLSDATYDGFKITITGYNNYRVTGWDYEISDDAGFSNVVASAIGVEYSAVDVTGLSNGTTYYVRIRGTNEAGTGDYTSSQNISTLAYNTWNGSANNGDWHTATNWSEGTVPVESDNVLIPSGLSYYPTLSATGTCNNLTIETNAALTIAEGKALTINGDLVNAGTFTVNSSASGTGSLIVHGTSSGDISFERYVTGDHWHYISAPVSGQAINDTWMDNNSIVNTPDYQFFRYDEDQAYWIIYTSTGNPEHFTDVVFGAGKGYTATRSGDGDLMFYGPLNTSAVNFEATYTTNGARGMNLSGNPFSSTIAITEEAQADNNFLADNAGILDDSYQAIYIWQESSNYSYGDNDYKVICNTGFTGEGSSAQLPEDFVQPGQAFMLKVKQTGSIVYNPDIRVHGTADFYKSKTSWPGVELQIEGNGQINSTIIAFNENMTSGLNPSYDVVKMKGNPNLSIYSALVEDNGNDYAVQALSDQNIEDYIVPIGVDVSEPATFEFSIYQELLGNYNIVLEDRLNSTFTNLRWEHYSTSISESGTGRFYLHFKDATAIEENQMPENNIVIYAANSVIYIAGQHVDLHGSSLIVTDITGRIVLRREISGSGLIAIPVNLETGIYIVAVENGNKLKIEKVFIK